MIAKFRETAADAQVRFDFGLGKEICGAFNGGKISVNGGLPLLREIDDRMRLTEQIQGCLPEHRAHPEQAVHAQDALIRQSLYQRACGYEDTNDADVVRSDPMFMVACGRRPHSRELASYATLWRFENAVTPESNERLQDLLVEIYIQSQSSPPERLELDMDTTCDPVHGNQQRSFYNRYYRTTCYTPLLMHTSDGFPLAAVLRPGNAGRPDEGLRTLKRVVARLKAAWPDVKILFRADNGFASPEMYAYCESQDITYFICVANNSALKVKPAVKTAVAEAHKQYVDLYGEPAPLHGKSWRQREERIRYSTKEKGRQQEAFELDEKRVRLYIDFQYKADSWPADRRMIGRIDYNEEGEDPMYVVTNYKGGDAKWLYERKYCMRGQDENWIKEQKALKCDRLSCQEFDANQFRLLWHTFAYILVRRVRELLPAQEAHISIGSVISRFFKFGVCVVEKAHRIWLHWPTEYPWRYEFRHALIRLRST